MTATKKEKLPLRYQATIVVEAKTPLVIGSGDKDLLLDNPIIRDAFELPYIPATSLAGVLRHTLALDEKTINSLFGYQEKQNEEGAGSRLIFSSAHLLAADNKVADGLEMATELQKNIQSWLLFPHRDHARINHKGVADKQGHGKFESELLMRGVRFVFDIELWGDEHDEENWLKILAAFAHPLFRIGAGTRKGFGALHIVEIWHKTFDLREKADLDAYLAKTTQIQIPSAAVGFAKFTQSAADFEGFIHYKLTLKPRDFFLFDGQFDLSRPPATKSADMTPKTEQILTWQDGKTPTLSDYKWLIPATSIKGAIAHRVAFHYNKNINHYAQNESSDFIAEIQNYLAQLNTANLSQEKIAEAQQKIAYYLAQLDNDTTLEEYVGEKNKAVETLFGKAAKENEHKENEGQRGRVIFSDIYLDKSSREDKFLNHVKIDRYTGGAIDTALFTEKVAHTPENFTLDIYVEKAAFQASEDRDIKTAFETTLRELCNEQLPLGGGVMRGHGMMRGDLKIIEPA
jgi:CRISPR/Cas system CMR subunit Cmr4 (Cas7 group RAMP superfamily)